MRGPVRRFRRRHPIRQRRSSNCLQVTQRVADGKAARRSTGIGLRHRSHHPYWPSSSRSRARSTCVIRSRMLLAREISCSRSKVFVPVSAWSSPAESVSRSRCISAISEIVESYSSRSSSRRSAKAARIFSVSAGLRVGRSGGGGAAGVAFAGAAAAAAFLAGVPARPRAAVEALRVLVAVAAAGATFREAALAAGVLVAGGFVAADLLAAGRVAVVAADLVGVALPATLLVADL